MATKKTRVVPAILTDSPSTLVKMIRQTELFTDFVQLDIMDGKFVPSKSVKCSDMVAVKPRLRWEAHLMVVKPEEYLDEYKKAGAEKIVFHYEATTTPLFVIHSIKKLGLKAGLAVNPETPNSAFTSLMKEADSVLYLAVHPGFYGAKFIPDTLAKVRDLRKAYPRMEIGLDGGVKENNIKEITIAGVDVIYVGSAISLQPDPAAAFKKLTALAQSV
jgi:ribulose-phosphate 3-epimerase